jgi:thiol-disulfide isomerase/thioredoxin
VQRVATTFVLLLAACGGLEDRKQAHRVELVEMPATTDVAAAVREHMIGKKTVVYTGASWCEPCQRFHEAAARGDLDLQFGCTRFLVFDLDRDRDALVAAGYKSVLIPLFAIPAADGTASAHHIEGGIKGDGALEQLEPRLRALLAEPL